MDQPTLAGTIIGFVAAMGFITHLLMKYEAYLDDRKLAIGFTMGFISGVIAFLVEQAGIFSFNVEDIEADSFLAFISIFGIAILHTALKGMGLNHKSLREGDDRNIAFYGTFFGFIFGAVYVTVIVSKSLKSGDIDSIAEGILLVLLSLGMVMFQGSTSIIMGWGIPNGKLFAMFGKISLAHIFMNLFIFMNAVNLIPSYLMVFFVLAFGLLLYTYCYQVVLPESLTKEQRRKLFPQDRLVRRQLSKLATGEPKKEEPSKSELDTRGDDGNADAAEHADQRGEEKKGEVISAK